MRRSFQASCFLLILLGCVVVSSAQVVPLAESDDRPDETYQPDDWRTEQPASLEELLTHLPGLDMARSGGMGSRTLLQVTGSGAARVRLALDGVEMNEPQWGWSRLHAVPVHRIARIDVYRTSEPPRIEIWTLPPPEGSPVTSFDLARGDLVTRTRRVSLQTPARRVQVGIHYEELLRGTHDFRVAPLTPAPAQLGSYDGRRVGVDLRFITDNGSTLWFHHFDHNENAHGTYRSVSDVFRNEHVGSRLRFSRPVGAWKLHVDLSNLAWDRDQILPGSDEAVTESRTGVGVDLARHTGSGPDGGVRLRLRDERGESLEAGELQRRAARRYDAVLHAGAGKRFWWRAEAGAHSHRLWGETWSGRGIAGWNWQEHNEVSLRLGRGVTFAGLGEFFEDSSHGILSGTYAALSLRRRGPRLVVQLQFYHKDLEAGSPAQALVFPQIGSGPSAVGGILQSFVWQGATQNYFWRLAADQHWLAHRQGTPSGLADFVAEYRASLTRRRWFEGDLVVTLQASGRFHSQRRFSDGSAIDANGTFDAGASARILKRLVFFWNVLNVLDRRVESLPGVAYPGRRSLVGLQVDLVN